MGRTKVFIDSHSSVFDYNNPTCTFLVMEKEKFQEFILSKARVKSLKMVQLTDPVAPDDPFFASVLADMQNVDGTKWGIFSEGFGLYSFWRKPIPPPPEKKK